MKELFHIENSVSDSGQKLLSLRLGDKHGSFAITNAAGSELYELAYCITDNPIATGWGENELNDLFGAYPSLHNTFSRVRLGYDSTESILISSKEDKLEDAGMLLNVLHNRGSNSNVITESINEWQLYNLYAAPKMTGEWVVNKFPAAESWHQYTVGIKMANASNTAGMLTVDFRPDDLTVIATKGSEFLLAQTFEYSTPEDVLYVLLKTCQQFSLSQQEVQLQLSGLIEKQSSLYKELYQYFVNIEFREASWQAGSGYPPHFFTSLNDLARCVS